MSAISIVRPTEQIAAILTDGAVLGEDGTVKHIGQKVAIFAHIQAAIAARGSHALALGLHAEFSVADSFESVLTQLPECARRVEAALKEHHSYTKPFEFWIVGYSHERQRAEGYFLATHSIASDPFELVEFDWLSSAPNPVSDWKLPRREQFDLVQDGAALMDAQRRQVDRQFCEGDPIHIAGGFAQLTTISRDSVTSSIIHRWRDRVGERIAPEAVKTAAET